MKVADVKPVEAVLQGLLQRSLVETANRVVDRSHGLGNVPLEADFTAALVLDFAPHLYHILKAVFPGTAFAVTGIYSHRRPFVQLPERGNAPLGDLLLVYVHTETTGTQRCNSLLLQVRKSRKGPGAVRRAEEHPLRLYTEWPAFTYRRAGRLSGALRDVLPKAPHDGAQYLLVDDHPFSGLSGLAGTSPWGCALPTPELCVHQDLATELVDFLQFKAGRTVEPLSPASRDGWTQVVWDLVRLAQEKAILPPAHPRDFPGELAGLWDGSCYCETEPRSLLADLHAQVRTPGKAPHAVGAAAAPSLLLVESFEGRGRRPGKG